MSVIVDIVTKGLLVNVDGSIYPVNIQISNNSIIYNDFIADINKVYKNDDISTLTVYSITNNTTIRNNLISELLNQLVCGTVILIDTTKDLSIDQFHKMLNIYLTLNLKSQIRSYFIRTLGYTFSLLAFYFTLTVVFFKNLD